MDNRFSLEVSTPEIAFPDVSVTQGRSIPVSEKKQSNYINMAFFAMLK